jgi:hypothetical protein
MVLYAFGNRGNPVTTIPHRLMFDEWKSRLEPIEIQAIDVEFNRIVGAKKGDELCTVSLLPCAFLPSDISLMGRQDWEGSSFLKIWDKACRRDRAHTCWCFGLLLWEHMMNRQDAWHFQKFDLDSVPMAATRYHRCVRRGSDGVRAASLVCCFAQPTLFSMGA